MWQDIAVFLITFAAVAFLAARAWRKFHPRKAGSCGGTCGCNASKKLPRSLSSNPNQQPNP